MKTTPFEYDAVILANGDYPTHAVPLSLLKQANYIVCCDGAANAYLGRGLTPNAIVGDGDSIAPAYRTQVADIYHLVSDQDTNDQTKAVRFLQKQGVNRIAILGATGGREDHTLGNISLLMDYLQEGLKVVMFTDNGVFTPANGTHTFCSHVGQQVSLFNFGATGMKCKDLIYPLSDFSKWWQGTLNESVADRFTIQAQGDYLVFQSY